jgi:hypothetical protein
MMEQWFRVERKTTSLLDQEPYLHYAIALRICEAIHAITMQRITRGVIYALSAAAGRR